MKKFIAAFDSLSFSESTLNYAIFLAKHSNAHLVGVFLEDISRRSFSLSEAAKWEGTDFQGHLDDLDEKDDELRHQSIQQFSEICQHAGVNYSVHRDMDGALQELVHESIYADMILIGASESMSRYVEPPPSHFIRDLLNEVQCPVLLTPQQYKPVEKVILLYDGEPSSVFALKSFSYLFNRMKLFHTEIVTVKDEGQSLHFQDNKLIKEFTKRHFPNAEYVALKGFPEDELVKYLQKEKKEPLIVLGAYRRSRVSRMFRKSMADHLLQHLAAPLFIAHNKS